MLTAMTTPLRVIQWSTGNVGRQSLRAIIERDGLELVGVHAWSPEKAGLDAARLCGSGESPADTGVLATDDVEALLGLRPDACVYNPLWPDADELVALLAAGINVATSAAWITGDRLSAPDLARIREACRAGNSSIVGSGAHPGLTNSVAMALSGGCARVDEIRITESVDASLYASGETMSAMGFGQHPDTPGLAESLRRESEVFAESAAMMADAMGVTVDRFSFDAVFTPATADTDLGFLQIPVGHVAGVYGLHRAWVGERTVVTTGFNWVMGPHVTPPKPLAHGHVIQVFGLPNLRTVVQTLPPAGMPPERWAELGMVLTAMPVLNALPHVVAAEPGIVTLAQLPPVTGPMS